MATLIFDIETVGEDWSALDDVTKKVLVRWIDKTSRNEKEREILIKDLKDSLGFSPLTGFIVAIGIYDLEREKGVVYYSGLGNEEDFEDGQFAYKQRDEAEMLSEFWQGAEHYDAFVTFNGRAFDVPFLLHRSVACEVKPTKNLMEGRYPSQQRSCRHVDLQDELTFFGAMYRKPSLHLFCRAFGIESPKEEFGGDDVAELFRMKKFRDIANYNARDVISTTQLYLKWLNYLDFKGREEALIDF